MKKENIEICKQIYPPWGEVISLNDGKIEVKVTLDIGPRIIYLALNQSENIMFEDKEDLINKGGEFFKQNFNDRIWHIYGGHRLWKSPEDLASYYPDSTKVKCEINGNTASFCSDEESTTGLIKSIAITMLGSGKLIVNHKFLNNGKEKIRAALWGLSVLKSGGTVYFPINDKSDGLLPSENYVLWPYTNIKDNRLTFNDNFISVKQKPIEQPFKLGAFLKKGVAGYINGNTVFIKKFGNFDSLPYPDFNCNFEVFTNKYMIECESLSPLFDIGVGESAEHIEEWQLFKRENDLIDINYYFG